MSLTPVAIVILLAAVFAADYQAPSGYAVWMLYVAPHALSLRCRTVYAPLIVGAALMALTVAGHWVSPRSEVSAHFDLMNRLLLCVASPVVSYMLYRQMLGDRLRLVSDERGRLLFDRMPIGCTITDADLTPTEWNAAAERIFGFSAAEILGVPPEQTITPRETWGNLDDVLAKLHRGENVKSVNPNRTKEGRTIWCEWHNTPLFHRDTFVGALSMVQDITDRRNSEVALKKLNGRVLAAQEQERRFLARELHDEVGQVLTAVSLNLETLRAVAPPDAQAAIEDSTAVVAEAIRQVRSLSLDLRPPMLDDFGLAPAVKWFIDQQNKRAGLPINADIPENLPRLPTEHEAGCYRIIQEAVTNALRHAKPGRIDVTVTRDAGAVTLAVTDDGYGFDPAASGTGFGLAGMRERAALMGGSLRVQSEYGNGTTVTARVPLDPIP